MKYEQKPDVMYIIATIIFWLINAVFDVSDYIFVKFDYILVCIISSFNDFKSLQPYVPRKPDKSL